MSGDRTPTRRVLRHDDRPAVVVTLLPGRVRLDSCGHPRDLDATELGALIRDLVEWHAALLVPPAREARG